MNKSILLGRLTKKPEIRYSQSNDMKIAIFSLAVNRKYAKQGEERQTDYFNIVSYSKLAEFAEKYLNQGTQICVAGKLQNRSWEDKNGITRYITEVIAEEIYFADSPKKADESILYSNTVHNPQTTQNGNEGVITSGEDDLPF